ncbi:SusC/RagA family TonB-linked outer membrane protein [Hymenobacter metallicola]|uniref:SusC/RagA family TonB-linked outer membrane protein n=1 Tax=Hymenobacter metallicola TaxID=2563114 RepID=A0A4Z0PZ31_9BACT|nr:SusC/RagA family TonB-linked outer membrane protein [Hymenobacter metallicola]TGE22977.1 SusC/RagA family TonB-linked outer membrane protein [Hymenobacter metallicola]
MKKLLFMVILLMTSLLQQAIAQDRAISGRVTDRANGQGLPGVTVLVKGTTIGASTNSDGTYTLSVPASATTLSFTSIGYVSVDRPIGTASTIDIGLSADTKQLGEVVVTALGREEQKKSLGYAVQDVQGAELTQARETNVVNSLAGRVAGVQISNSTGAAGSSSRIVIRGPKSVQGNNQPLFVIDGQPIDNSSFSNSGAGGGIDYGNAASDLNPDDIESMTVLKGANATALYGVRGSNGVVVITTKSGRKARGLGISLNSTTSFESALTIPDLQNEYGQGNNGEFSYVDGQGSGVNDGSDESWGPRFNGQLIPQYNSPVVNGVRQATPWVGPGKDNLKKHFFETGRTLTNNIAVSGGNEKAGVRVSFTNLDSKGILYNTYLRRNTVNVNGGADITSKFKVSTNINYSETRGRRPGQGYDELNVMQQLYTWYGRQVDVRDLKNYYESGQRNYNWNSNYHNNPYFVLGEATNDDQRDRIIGNLTLTYALTDWLNLTARTTNDIYNQFNQRRVPIETISNDVQDDYTEERIRVLERNTEFLATANRNLTEDINLDVLLGANRRDAELDRSQIAAPELAVPGLFTLGNSASPLVTGNNFGTSNSNNGGILNPVQNRRVNSVYGSGRIGYKNWAFLGGSYRNDWSSNLPANARSFGYGSVDASVVLTDAFGITDSPLSFAKIRAGIANAGNDGTFAYQTQDIFTGGTAFGTDPVQTIFNTSYNPNLKPENTASYEAGVEVRFLKDRIGLDVTGYKTVTTDQIITVLTSASAGYTSKVLNAGEVTNQGIEAILTVAPFAAESPFQWNITANFAANRNRVVKFDDEGLIKNFVIGSSGFNTNIEARVGERYGAIFATGFLKVPDGQYAGQLILDANGLPQADPTRRTLGYATPDWIGGITNRFGYKGMELSFTIDTRQGGEFQSETVMWGTYAGSLANTLEGREGGLVAAGVLRNADGSFRPNDVRATAEDYYKAYGYIAGREGSVLDASFVKLREVRFGYQLPKSLIEGTFVKGVGVSFVGRNLWLIKSNAMGLDPETSFNNGNAQGLESTQIPSVRSLGFNINVTL